MIETVLISWLVRDKAENLLEQLNKHTEQQINICVNGKKKRQSKSPLVIFVLPMWCLKATRQRTKETDLISGNTFILVAEDTEKEQQSDF